MESWGTCALGPGSSAGPAELGVRGAKPTSLLPGAASCSAARAHRSRLARSSAPGRLGRFWLFAVTAHRYHTCAQACACVCCVCVWSFSSSCTPRKGTAGDVDGDQHLAFRRAAGRCSAAARRTRPPGSRRPRQGLLPSACLVAATRGGQEASRWGSGLHS